MHKTNAYAFTITSLDDPKLSKLRDDIKTHNRIQKKFYTHRYNNRPLTLRVCVKARLGKKNPNRGLYKNSFGGAVRLEHGSRFDVYVQTR